MIAAGIEVRSIVAIRNPIEVCRSLAKRKAISWEDAALLWLRHSLSAELAPRGQSRGLVLYDDLLRDWRREFERISRHANIAWSLHQEYITVEIDIFLNAEHRHHAAGADALKDNKLTHGWLLKIFEAAQVLVSDPGSQEAMTVFDEVAQEFSRAMPFLEAFHARIPEETKGLKALRKPKKQPKPIVERVSAEMRRWRSRAGLN